MCFQLARNQVNMALQKEKTTQYGSTANYWRIFNLNTSKGGGEPTLNMNVSIGLYLDKEHSDNGKGAFETRSITFGDGFEISHTLLPEDEVTTEQVSNALEIIMKHLYDRIRTGNYELSDDEENYFSDSVNV